jgi:hypothetical protein
MMMTQQQTLPLKKPADRESAVPKRDERVEESAHGTPVERLDWRGEGVVGNNHTD